MMHRMPRMLCVLVCSSCLLPLHSSMPRQAIGQCNPIHSLLCNASSTTDVVTSSAAVNAPSVRQVMETRINTSVSQTHSCPAHVKGNSRHTSLHTALFTASLCFLWCTQVNGRFGIQASLRMTPSQAASRAVQDNCCYITRSTPTHG
jgi:hypothetical protein